MKVYVQAVRQKHKSCSPDTSNDQVSTTTKPPKTADLRNLGSFRVHHLPQNEDEK